MKLKFRADAQDVLIFVLFAIFLLYVVAIGVLNIPVLLNEGHFYGLNPFPAFGPQYLFTTLLFYILFLGGIFATVSSYFFEREEGFGFTTNKKDKGYSRWAKEKEMKKELKYVNPSDPNSSVAGVPLILKDNEIWVDDGEYHNLVIGATGSGKTQTVIFPTVELLAKHKESMIITDPKGEIYEATANMLKDKGYNILLLNFRDPQQGNAWNPLSLPYNMYKSGNQDKAIELLDDLAANILYEENSGNADPFWEKTSADYFSGLSLGMFEDAKPEEVNINTISLMTTVGEEKCGGSTYAKEYFSFKDPASPAYVNASGTIMAPNETKGSIIAVFKQKIKLFASRENLSEMLSYNDVNLEEIGEKPTALFIVIQDEKKTYHSLVTILLKQCYETLISVAQKHGGKLPVRTNFLLDEFANMPPLKDITTMITAARSRRIRFTMIIQNFAQLDQVYGKENAETIRGNCGNIIYLITTELKALEEISKMCGEVKSKKDDKTASTPLVTVSDLQRMKQFEVIILRIRMQPFKTKFTPYYKMKPKFGKSYPKATYPEREKREVKVFNIKDYVNKFNKENEDFRILIKPYEFDTESYSAWDKVNEDLNRDIAAGNIPDIILTNYIDVSSYVKSGLFTDHRKFIENDPEISNDVLNQSVCSVFTYKDSLYCIPVTYTSSVLVSAEKKDKLTYDEFLNITENNEKVFRPYSYPWDYLINSYFCDSVDLENGKCDFDNETFVSLLEFAKKGYGNEEEEDYSYEDDGYILDIASVNGIYDYDNIDEYYPSTPNICGFPSESGEGRQYIYPLLTLAVTEASENKSEAWAFIKSLADKQDVYTPCFFRLSSEGNENYPENTVKGYEEYTKMPAFTGLMYSRIHSIVAEEMEAFNADQRTAEETAKVIQNKVSLMLSETE